MRDYGAISGKLKEHSHGLALVGRAPDVLIAYAGELGYLGRDVLTGQHDAECEQDGDRTDVDEDLYHTDELCFQEEVGHTDREEHECEIERTVDRDPVGYDIDGRRYSDRC